MGWVLRVSLPTWNCRRICFGSALIGFNIGVEVGQLSVVLAAAVLVRLCSHKPTQEAAYRKWVVRPGSGLIGLCGLWWGVSAMLQL